ncbi:MAG: gamma-glutamylcyclotransferase [Chloroflexi bacterium]|nr:gamma-glutamylcyclotransferase [Chloroflexota bacterium]
MSMKSTPRLLPFFVYGTLLPGQPNAHLWGDGIVAQQNATLANGRLYDLGAFPMLVEEGEEKVVGCLITLQPEQYHTTLAKLDELEGYDPAQPTASAYRREPREVLGEDGRSYAAWVYIGHATALPGMMPIPGGDWRRHVAATFQDVDEWWQTVQSVHGMLKPPEQRGAA